MTTHEAYQYENYNGLISLNSILKDFECSDFMFESLLSVINDEDEFVKKLFEVEVLEIKDGYIPEAYAALEESFIYNTEMNPRLIELPKELMALRFADRIKEAIKKYTPEYYNFLYYINYYDYRLLPILTDSCKNKIEIIEIVLRDKATGFIIDFMEKVFPELTDHVAEELDDDIIAFIIPKIIEYNRTTIADKEVVMRMIINPEALFPLKTENYDMSNAIVQTLLEQIDKRNELRTQTLNTEDSNT